MRRASKKTSSMKPPEHSIIACGRFNNTRKLNHRGLLQVFDAAGRMTDISGANDSPCQTSHDLSVEKNFLKDIFYLQIVFCGDKTVCIVSVGKRIHTDRLPA